MEKTDILSYMEYINIQSYNKICKNFECLLRMDKGERKHEKSTGFFFFGKALCLCFVYDFQSLK